MLRTILSVLIGITFLAMVSALYHTFRKRQSLLEGSRHTIERHADNATFSWVVVLAAALLAVFIYVFARH